MSAELNTEMTAIEAWLGLARKYNLKYLRLNNFEAKFFPDSTVTTEDILPKPTLEGDVHMPSDEQMLFYSTPTYDELTAEATAKAEQKDME